MFDSTWNEKLKHNLRDGRVKDLSEDGAAASPTGQIWYCSIRTSALNGPEEETEPEEPQETEPEEPQEIEQKSIGTRTRRSRRNRTKGTRKTEEPVEPEPEKPDEPEPEEPEKQN